METDQELLNVVEGVLTHLQRITQEIFDLQCEVAKLKSGKQTKDNTYKLVNYLGNEYAVPPEANWIAADSDGVVFVFDAEPKLVGGTNFYVWESSKGSGFVCHVSPNVEALCANHHPCQQIL